MSEEQSIIEKRPERRNLDNRIFVRLSSQISLTISGENIFTEVQRRVLRWTKDRVGSLPNAAWKGESFEIEADHLERVSVIKMEQPNSWVMRLSERLKDPGRIWTTEVGIAVVNPEKIVFGCRLLCSERGVSTKVPRSIPAFVRAIVFTQNTLLDNRRQGDNPWFVNSDSEAYTLSNFIQWSGRKHPVVVFALPEDSNNPEETIIPTKNFIRSTVGFVHTVVLSSSASLILTQELGREYTVFRQAIRTYYPNFNQNDDLSTDHPVATPQAIENWEGDNDFKTFLVTQVLRPTRSREELEKDHPPFEEVRRRAAQISRKNAVKEGENNDPEIIQLYEQEIDSIKKDAEDSLGLFNIADEEKNAALAKAREINASYMTLQHQVDSLRKRLAAQSLDQDDPLPESLAELEAWAQDNLSGSVEIHERAIKFSRESDFEEVELVYKTLLMMRDFYVPMRRKGGIELRQAYDNKLQELKLEDTKCFTQNNKAKQFRGEYFIKYQGEKQELSWHLKGKNSRDERYGFRLYYLWDTETGRVVVGHLPSHLRNDIS